MDKSCVGFIKKLLQIAAPIVLQQIINIGVNVSDGIMVGNIPDILSWSRRRSCGYYRPVLGQKRQRGGKEDDNFFYMDMCHYRHCFFSGFMVYT